MVSEYTAACYCTEACVHQCSKLSASKGNASGSAIGIQIAKVPQEDPVANAIIAEMMKIIAGSIAGVRKLSLKDTI